MIKTTFNNFLRCKVKGKQLLQGGILFLMYFVRYAAWSQCGTPVGFGTGKWNVEVYNAGDGYGGSGAWKNNYVGYYTENNLSFDTRNRWASGTSSPSSANSSSGSPFQSACVPARGTTSNSWFSYTY